jgi:hypothetical protein
VSTTLDTMPVFVKAGGIVATRSGNVANDVQNPLSNVTLDVASGASGHFGLYEDAGTGSASATTPIDYAETASAARLTIGAQQGDYSGRVASRAWTVRLHGVAAQARDVTVDGAPASSSYDPATHTLTITTPSRPTDAPTTIVISAPQTTVGGTVPATLSLTLGAPASFGAFTPGVEKTYSAATTANVISTAGDAALSVSDPGHLRNGSFWLPDPLQVSLSKTAWTAPVSNDPVLVAFSQHIGAGDPLRTGTYSATLTFTLSTTSP